MTKTKIAILGASGYTGSELVRLLLVHPYAELKILTADRRAGEKMAAVFPQFAPFALPDLVSIESIDWAKADVNLVFCALPHGTTQLVIKDIFTKRPDIKVVDLSADFRLFKGEDYAKWYGHAHQALDLQAKAVYGLCEVYREEIKNAKLVANPGCYTTASILPLLPLIRAQQIKYKSIIIDAKSGVTGAGRAAKEANLFTEVSEGFHAYGVGGHRHSAELDQEFSKAAKQEVIATFTPHLLPQNRGILATIYVECASGVSVEMLHEALRATYINEPFVHILPLGQTPQTRHVRGSNMVMIGVAKDRIAGRAILVCALDNLVKGASGQAVQNMNLVMGYAENTGLQQVALFP
jgi:N-acetyl-gamma-glutamyl-phosphate reductase